MSPHGGLEQSAGTQADLLFSPLLIGGIPWARTCQPLLVWSVCTEENIVCLPCPNPLCMKGTLKMCPGKIWSLLEIVCGPEKNRHF